MSRRVIDATCPECRVPLTEISDGGPVEYECLVGRRYSPEALLHAHSDTEERALWAAVVALGEAQHLVEAVARYLPASVGASLEAQADKKSQQATQVRKIIEELSPFRI